MFKYFLHIILLVALFSCEEEKPKEKELNMPTSKESSEMNKAWVKKEYKLIENYIERNQWEVQTSGTGLNYLIYKEGSGEEVNSGDEVMIDFKITLLDGTVCYSTDETGPVPFIVDKDNVESGLHEGVSYMRVGDKAKLIIPSYLAHGLAGDLNKIPMQSTLIYDVSVLGVSKY